jgi:hypothetical protein
VTRSKATQRAAADGGAAVLFGAMAFAAKLASTRLSGSQVAMIRFATDSLPRC